jgi:hypothetical protein
MADFVAVIRRAVDGLTDNTPEMRVRVYEKARGAVVRQLENMNPRPPEAMFKRQLDKLDAAIRQVEEENGEAVPADAAPAEAPVEAAPAVAAVAEHAAVVEHAAEPVSAPQPQSVDAEAARHEVAAPVSQDNQPVEATSDEAVAGEPVPVVASEPVPEEPIRHEEPLYQPEPVSQHEAIVASREQSDLDAGPAVDYADDVPTKPAQEEQIAAAADSVQSAEPYDVGQPALPEQPVQDFAPVMDPYAGPGVAPADDRRIADEQVDPLLSHFEQPSEPARRHAANRVMEEPYVDAESEFPGAEPERAVALHPAETTPKDVVATVAAPDWGVDIDREPETVVEDPTESPPMPRASLTESDVASNFNSFLKNEFATPAVKPPPQRKETEEAFSWDTPFDDLPDLPKPVAFQDALDARQEQLARTPEPQQPAAPARDARSELEDLIGYSPVDNGAGTDSLAPEISRGMSKLEGKSFKVHKKKPKFNPLPIAFGIAGALVVAGGAYGVYAYRDDVSALVASYMPKETAPVPAETRAVDGKTEDAVEQTKNVTTNTTDTAAKQQPAAAETVTEDKPTEVASLDPNIAAGKFTQRLMADGTETETDAAKIPVDQSLSEGKTIAGQTEVASSNPEATVTEPVAQTPGLAVTQKMFLYEERLGGSPVAVPGTVSWSLKNDTTSGGSQPQQMVEATVEVPERKLKAVVSFKRNADPSLPASHIIEVVFDLPEDFAEGNVESVQRVAFKQTEQDRGNSLIAVPAKITDDFHMIALNDDADARKVNTELMKTRAWIDIPVIYRNNRRALLTFEKGSTGTEAFDKAMAQWAALTPTATTSD